jgi:hypothetical protein
VAALEVLDQLASEQTGSNEARVLAKVRAEILTDPQELGSAGRGKPRR